jgi:hypothetical protein
MSHDQTIHIHRYLLFFLNANDFETNTWKWHKPLAFPMAEPTWFPPCCRVTCPAEMQVNKEQSSRGKVMDTFCGEKTHWLDRSTSRSTCNSWVFLYDLHVNGVHTTVNKQDNDL